MPVSLIRLTVAIAVVFIAIGFNAWGQGYVPGEVIVKLKSSVSQNQSYHFLGKATMNKMSLKTSFNRMQMYHFQGKMGQSVESMIAEIQQDPSVEYAEPNYYFTKASLGRVEQTFSAAAIEKMSKEGVSLSAYEPLPSHALSSLSSSRTIVAVIDTGIDLTHKVFVDSDAVWVNSGEIANNGLDDDGNGYVDDVNGWNFVDNSATIYDDDDHGTHVAGTILSMGMDIYNAPFSQSPIRLMPLKFLDNSGVGKTSDAIAAIYYAVSNGAKVINNSWGGPSYSGALHEAIAFSYNRNVSFVAAAGNAGSNNDVSPMYPASYPVPHVISVAAITDSDYLASFSNYGAQSVHLGSRGVSILSTVPGNVGAQDYGYSSGTSMATPFVSGMAALMLNEKPTMLPYQTKSLIFEEALELSQLSLKVSSNGRLDPTATLSKTSSASVDTTQPGYDFSNEDRELASALSSGGGCGMVAKVYDEIRRGGPGAGSHAPTWYVLGFLILLLSPVFIASYLRQRDPVTRRQHERFNIETDVRVRVGNKELVGSISTISMGGVCLNTNALLESGGLVSMSITSPDGNETISVEGRVVWSDAQQAYGVQFDGARQSVLEKISGWTEALTKAS